ncbi:hypothetical protein CW751_07850 [Brumimicrobium salinarum]|uniref:DUF1853 domain-containing protein n=1 Tax=Brumimicrobium salinarum TaxID=2058658 RepID=A0A2I0R265_9FLAO|nr:DUF1853 family protein [Brumimicrobium salinarum]PKR80674.1 hypothetical protein CW751_07850 [Brumimicrobium salinarum]
MKINDEISLKNIMVKDLYWLLFSTSPLSHQYSLSSYALFPFELQEEWKVRAQTYFIELDQNPKPLEVFLHRKKNKRLGFYAEALLSYFFQTFRPITLLLQNHQIIDNKTTIGEIDFIIAYEHQVIHLECAVKYYLLSDKHRPDLPSNWIGPRKKDHLGLKLEKVLQHQLPLGKSKSVFHKINKNIDVSYLFLKGIFFTNNVKTNNKICQKIPKRYVYQSEAQNLTKPVLGVLERPNWLSATQTTSINEVSFTTIDLNIPLVNPQLLILENSEVIFVVPDDW